MIGWRAGGRRAKFAIIAIGFDLRALLEPRQDKWMASSQRQHPSARGASARDFDHHAMKRRDVEFVAAEAARLHDAIETRARERLIGRGQDAPCPFAFGLLRAQHPAHLAGARDHRLGREGGLGRFDLIDLHPDRCSAIVSQWLQVLPTLLLRMICLLGVRRVRLGYDFKAFHQGPARYSGADA